MQADPWKRLGVQGPELAARVVVAQAAANRVGAGPKEEGVKDWRSLPRKRKAGAAVPREIKECFPCGDAGSKAGSIVEVLTCGHALTGVASRAGSVRSCYLCGRLLRKSEQDAELLKSLRDLVKRQGSDFVLEKLSEMERSDNELDPI